MTRDRDLRAPLARALLAAAMAAAIAIASGCGSDETTGPNPPASGTITATAGSNGSISPGGAVSVSRGTDQTFAIAPGTDYYVADVLVDGASVGAVASYTFTNVQANHTIAASFVLGVGKIVTWAGDGRIGWDGDGHTLLESAFYWPIDMTITSEGETYILDWNNHRVRHLTSGGVLETVIGTQFVGDGPEIGSTESERVEPGAIGTSVNLNHPTNFTPLPNGKILLTSWHNHKLREYDPTTGRVMITCGSDPGFAGDGGPALSARLSQPTQTTVDQDGNLYILDMRNERIRKINAIDGMISTVVGTGTPGYSGDDGPPTAAQLNLPRGPNPPVGGAVAFDSQQRLYISDTLNNRIRRVDFAANTIVTVAGNGVAGAGGDDGPGTAASLNNPRDLVVSTDGRLFIADELNNRIRTVDISTGMITTVAGTGTAGFSGDGGPAAAAMLNRPTGLELDSNGHLYIVDQYNHRIRRVVL